MLKYWKNEIDKEDLRQRSASPKYPGYAYDRKAFKDIIDRMTGLVVYKYSAHEQRIEKFVVVKNKYKTLNVKLERVGGKGDLKKEVKVSIDYFIRTYAPTEKEAVLDAIHWCKSSIEEFVARKVQANKNIEKKKKEIIKLQSTLLNKIPQKEV